MMTQVAVAIRGLRQKLGKNQTAFCQLIGVNQGVLSDWENGNKRPKGENLIALGKLADGAQRQFFWEQTGLDPWEMQEQGARKKREPQDSNSIEVSLLKDAAAAGLPRQIDDRDVDRVMSLPRFMVPHPENTLAVRAEGDSMYPILDDGYICLVDTSQLDKKRLENEMVLARDPEGGATIKWLRKHSNKWMLVPQHTTPDNPVFLLDEGWGGHWPGSALDRTATQAAAEGNSMSEAVAAGKRCPYCAETIQAEAVKCRYCGEFMTDEARAGAAKAKKSGGIAALLSLIIPGAGQIYRERAGFGLCLPE